MRPAISKLAGVWTVNIAELDLEKAANALVVLILGLAAAFGWNRRKQAAPQEEVMEVSAAIVSDKAAREIIEALDRNTEALERNSETAEDMRDEIRDVTRSMSFHDTSV